MNNCPKILAFSGSSRVGSLNRMLLDIAVTSARSVGAEVTVLDLRDLGLPIYDGDVEATGLPAGAVTLREQLFAHDALLIASPEYNGSVTPLLKNALDWASRPHGGKDGLAPYQGKVAALMGASMGVFGGLRGVSHLRAILAKMGVTALADETLLPVAHGAFEGTSLKDPAVFKLLHAQVLRLVDTVRVLT